MEIRAELGDVTKLSVDAIVNAANTSLSSGSGVNGAIQRAAGPDLLDYCSTLGGCPTGEAKVSPGFRLPAKWVIHTVGPVWQGGSHGEPELLASCYRRSLAVADEVGARSVAFPAISTGIFGYPLEEATTIAVSTVKSTASKVQTVIFVCFDRPTLHLYQQLIGE